MNRSPRKLLLGLAFAGCFLSGCGPGQPFGPAVSPPPTGTSTPTAAPTPTRTLVPSATPLPIPGVGTPILIEGIGILFTGAELYDTFAIDDQAATPVFSADMYLLVAAVIPEEYLDKAMTAGIQSWDVTVNDSIPYAYFSSQFGIFNRVRQGKLSWVFAVGKTETSFVLHFPGGIDFNLAPLL